MKVYLPLLVASAAMSIQASAANLSKCVDSVGKITYADMGTSGNCVEFDPARPGGP